MNMPAISQEALDRFRVAASQYNHATKSRASRLLLLKDDIAGLRKRCISYRAISELLTQNGISASDTCVTNFCHRVLKEPPVRKSAGRRRASHHSNHGVSLAPSNGTSAKTTPLPTAKSPAELNAVASLTTRGPRIAKVEQLPPGEKI